MDKHQSIIQHELHLHLYGCLEAVDVWELGKSRWQGRKEALAWYAAEFARVWGRSPQWESYWTTENGYERLREDYCFLGPASFQHFQACFNLIIALFPLNLKDDSIIRFVIEKLARQNLRYVELRLPFGMSFARDYDAIHDFLTMVARISLEYETSSFVPRIAITLPRDNQILEFQYDALRSWLDTNHQFAHAITAIDFCGTEEGNPPKGKKEFFARVLADNARHPETALAILYHVGESFQSMSLESAIRWVWEANAYGAHRLGHCIALGINPRVLLGKPCSESLTEQNDHQEWLVNNAHWLTDAGYDYEPTSDAHRDCYTEERVRKILRLQNAVIADLKRKDVIIEVCPSSNLLIGMIRDSSWHPLRRFLQAELKIVIASDDPGIFETHLAKEEEICRRIYGMTNYQINEAAKIAQSAIAERLVQRS